MAQGGESEPREEDLSCDVHLVLGDRRVRQRPRRSQREEDLVAGAEGEEAWMISALSLWSGPSTCSSHFRLYDICNTQPLLAMALPWLWCFSLWVLLGETLSPASATNYQSWYYRRICYRPHCYHGYHGYHGHDVGRLTAGKRRRSCRGFKFPRFSKSAGEKNFENFVAVIFGLLLSDLTLYPFDVFPLIDCLSYRRAQWLRAGILSAAWASDGARSQTGAASD